VKKIWRCLLSLTLAASVAGCYGPFSLTRKLHRWNGEIGEKWVNEGVFVAMVIFPVYGLSALADALVFNSVEFWTGKNPVYSKAPRELSNGDYSAVLSYRPDSRRLRVDRFKKGRPAGAILIEPSADGMLARSADGGVLLRAITVDGRVLLRDAQGREIARRDPAELAQLLASRP